MEYKYLAFINYLSLVFTTVFLSVFLMHWLTKVICISMISFFIVLNCYFFNEFMYEDQELQGLLIN